MNHGMCIRAVLGLVCFLAVIAPPPPHPHPRPRLICLDVAAATLVWFGLCVASWGEGVAGGRRGLVYNDGSVICPPLA